MFQFRDSDPAILNRLEAVLREQVAAFHRAGPCSISVETIRQSTPAVMDESFQQAIEQAAERHAPGLAVLMPSGAGHDAQHVARVMPAAMLFVPSINGVSHHWTESSSDEDIGLGACVFTDAIASVLMRCWQRAVSIVDATPRTVYQQQVFPIWMRGNLSPSRFSDALAQTMWTAVGGAPGDVDRVVFTSALSCRAEDDVP
jgi:hypothetical protein